MTSARGPAGDDRFDAVVLAGGRASRLGGVPKPTLVVEGATLEHHALAAAADAARTVVVGPEPTSPYTAGSDPARPGGRDVVRTREDPPFGGPVAGLDAGLRALRRGRTADAGDGRHAPWVLVLAVDVPRATGAVPLLRAAVASAGAGTDAGTEPDGAYLVRDGKAQWLVGLYRHDALRRALAEVTGADGLAGVAVRQLVARLRCLEVPDAEGLSLDVDTWDDVRRLTVGLHEGVAETPATPGSTRSQEGPR